MEFRNVLFDEKSLTTYDPTLFNHANFEKCIFEFSSPDTILDFDFSSSNFNDCLFKNIQFPDKPIFKDVQILRSTFENTGPLKSKTFDNAHIEGTKMININVSSWLLSKIEGFYNCMFLDCWIDKYIEGYELQSQHPIITGIWDEIEMKNTSISGLEFKDFQLNYCIFEDCKFFIIDFNTCGINSCGFTKCEFDKVNFNNKGVAINEERIIIESKFEYCKFESVDFTKIILLCVSFYSNRYDYRTKFSVNYYEKFEESTENVKCNILDYCITNMEEPDIEIRIIESYITQYYNLYAEYKGTSMVKEAYEFYFIYRFLTLLKYKSYLNNKKSVKNFKKYLNQYIQYKSCGFGEKPFWTFKIIFFIIIVNSFFYMITGIGGKDDILYHFLPLNYGKIFPEGYTFVKVNGIQFIEDYLTCLYFSIISFATIGYGDFYPITFLSRFLIVIQTCISTILITVFTTTFVRKLFRD